MTLAIIDRARYYDELGLYEPANYYSENVLLGVIAQYNTYKKGSFTKERLPQLMKLYRETYKRYKSKATWKLKFRVGLFLFSPAIYGIIFGLLGKKN